MCGEKHNRSYQQGLERGSPPHVRGKGSGGNGPLFDGGITPACAGKRFDQRRQFVESEDHPRMCGEKGGVLRRAPQRPGSPPRMRGKAGKHRGHVPASRITPAYAGKSPGDENRQDAARDHPRVCGEKKIANSDELAVEGSPPRMRGKVLKNRVKSGQPRITPAYAGKRLHLMLYFSLLKDHPRVCGEKLKTKKK